MSVNLVEGHMDLVLHFNYGDYILAVMINYLLQHIKWLSHFKLFQIAAFRDCREGTLNFGVALIGKTSVKQTGFFSRNLFAGVLQFADKVMAD